MTLRALAFISGLVCALPSWAQSAGPPQGLLHMPEGPYASWSESDRKNGEQAVKWKCGLLNALLHASGKKSPADDEAMIAFIMSCVATEFPPDWPAHESFLAQAKAHAAAAKKIDPTYPEAALIYKPVN